MKFKRFGRFLERVATALGIETESSQRARYEKLWRENPEIRQLVPKPRCPNCSRRLDGENDSDYECGEQETIPSLNIQNANNIEEKFQLQNNSDINELKNIDALGTESKLTSAENMLTHSTSVTTHNRHEGSTTKITIESDSEENNEEIHLDAAETDKGILLQPSNELNKNIGETFNGEFQGLTLDLNASSLIDHEFIDFNLKNANENTLSATNSRGLSDGK